MKKNKKITVGARFSPLSLAQIKEVKAFFPNWLFQPLLIETTGDLDLKSSLRKMEKTNFFTKELDELLLNKKCDITIHSAKNLPQELPEDLTIAAITQGIDKRDALVLPEKTSLDDIPINGVIGASTERREKAVLKIKKNVSFREIRGSIEKRLAFVEKGLIAGLVLEEAALIRLNLTHLNRIILSGETAPLQGQLAIVCRKDNISMQKLFQRIDNRRTTLYLGIDPPAGDHILHYPIIHTSEIPYDLPNLNHVTHTLFTSKTAARLLSPIKALKSKPCIAIGQSTADILLKHGFQSPKIPSIATSEGVVKLLKTLNLQKGHLLWPHSVLSRPVISQYLKQHKIPHSSVPVYTTTAQSPFPLTDFTSIREIVFTSPSTVDAFFTLYPNLPKKIKLIPIGPITALQIQKHAHLKTYT